MSWGSVAGKQSAPAPPNKPRVEVTVTLVPGDTGCFGVRHTFSQALIELYKRDFAPGKFVAALSAWVFPWNRYGFMQRGPRLRCG